MDWKSKIVFMSSMCLLFAAYSYSDVRSHGAASSSTTAGMAVQNGVMPVDPDLVERDVPAHRPAFSALDQRILSKIHHTDLMEIEMGLLAQQKGTTRLIRAYGDRLARDHRFADQKILLLAQQMGININAPLPFLSEDEEQMRMQLNQMERLREASGSDFDQVFLATMRSGHAHSIEMLTNADQQLESNVEIKHLMEKLIPILKQHETVADHLTLNANAHS